MYIEEKKTFAVQSATQKYSYQLTFNGNLKQINSSSLTSILHILSSAGKKKKIGTVLSCEELFIISHIWIF